MELWSGVLARYIDRSAVLDVGSGIGSWSELIAERFDAEVIGVEPSSRMREVAEREHSHPRVRYREGSAEQIPLADASSDVAFLSYVIHHVGDRAACGRELRRVLRPGGLVLVRSTLREALPRVPLFDFFPEALQVAEERMPTRATVTGLFEDHGFELLVDETIEQEMAPDLRAYYERVKPRAISTLELLGDAEFERGLERLRLAAERERDPEPVSEPVNLLVFRREGPPTSPPPGR